MPERTTQVDCNTTATSSTISHPPLKTSLLQEFAGPGMKSRVDQILAMDINGDEGEDVTFSEYGGNGIAQPYLSYGAGDNANTTGASVMASDERSKTSRPKTGKKREAKGGAGGNADNANYYNGGERASSSSRPKSAARRREGNNGAAAEETRTHGTSATGGTRYLQDDELYPTARGLIKK